jgi:hypothetical protein
MPKNHSKNIPLIKYSALTIFLIQCFCGSVSAQNGLHASSTKLKGKIEQSDQPSSLKSKVNKNWQQEQRIRQFGEAMSNGPSSPHWAASANCVPASADIQGRKKWDIFENELSSIHFYDEWRLWTDNLVLSTLNQWMKKNTGEGVGEFFVIVSHDGRTTLQVRRVNSQDPNFETNAKSLLITLGHSPIFHFPSDSKVSEIGVVIVLSKVSPSVTFNYGNALTIVGGGDEYAGDHFTINHHAFVQPVYCLP